MGFDILTQVVGNVPPLSEYKARQLATGVSWLPDISISGRTVIVGVMEDNCQVHTRSGASGVGTVVFYFESRLTVDEVCAKAIEFTRATIDKMPP